MGHFARDYRLKWRTAQGNTATSNNLEEEWTVESCLVVIESIEEAVEEEAMLTNSKEIEEKCLRAWGSSLGKISSW